MPPLRLLALGIILRAELLLGAIAATSFFGFFFCFFLHGPPTAEGLGVVPAGVQTTVPVASGTQV